MEHYGKSNIETKDNNTSTSLLDYLISRLFSIDEKRWEIERENNESFDSWRQKEINKYRHSLGEELNREFKFLPLREYFERTELPFSTLNYAFESITPRGRKALLDRNTLLEGVITPHGCIQLFLLTTDPFGSGNQKNMIYDTRDISYRPLRCSDFSALLENISSLLLDYESERCKANVLPEDFNSSVNDDLNSLAHFIEIVSMFKNQRNMPARMNISRNEIRKWKKNFEELREVYIKYSPYILSAMNKSKKEKEIVNIEEKMLLDMHGCFRKYGPVTRYPNDAIFRCLAEIFYKLEIEKTPTKGSDPIAIIAERFKKRFYRAQQKSNA